MNLLPYTWNGYAINDWKWNGTGIGEWSSEFPMGERANLHASSVYSPIAYNFPKLSTVQANEHTITVTFHPKSLTHTLAYMREQLKQWFPVGVDYNPHQLIAQDIEDSNRQWYLSGIPIDVVQNDAGEFQVTLAVADPVWRVVTQTTTGNFTVNASPTTKALTLLGNIAAQPIITIAPQTARTGSYSYKRYIKLYNPTTKPFPFPVSSFDVTFGGFDSTTLVPAKALASGNDVRLMVDGSEVNRWFGTGTHAWNQTATQIWANIPHSAGQVGTLSGTLPNNGTAVTVPFKKTAANLAVLKALAIAVNPAFLIGSEIFTFSRANVDLVNYQITSCNRAQKGTSFAAHSDGDNVTWIEHDIWLLYGNAAATAPDIDDTQKPMLDLGSSTNSSWVWSTFYDTTAPRPAAWTPLVVSSIINKLAAQLLTNFYTGDATALADPATELGLQMQTYNYNNVWKAETGILQWSFYHPAGFTTASMSGKKYAYDITAWPSVAGLQKSKDNKNFSSVWNEAKPTTAQTPATFTHNTVSLSGTYLYLALLFKGSIAAKASNQAYIQGDTVTLALGTGTLTGAMLAEQNNYQFTANIKNNTSGESVDLNVTMNTSLTLTIDFGAKTVTLSDGTNVFNGLSLSPNRVNADWLDIGQDSNQKFTGAASIVITESGVVNETWNISYRDSGL